MGTAGDPSQGRDTESHGVAEEKQQEAQWSSRKKPMHTKPQPPEPPLTSPEGLRQAECHRGKTGQAETRKGGGDTGNVLDLSLEKGGEEGLLLCLFNYLCSLFANT